MKIMFVCSGNTGRSPMAQFVMQKLIADAGLSEKISVSSAASKPTDGGGLHQGIATKLRMEKIPQRLLQEIFLPVRHKTVKP